MNIKKNILGALTFCKTQIKKWGSNIKRDANVAMRTPCADRKDNPKYSRIKQPNENEKQLNINGVNVPPPITEKPSLDDKYFVIDQDEERGYTFRLWDGDKASMRRFRRGIYTNEDHIKQYVKALWGGSEKKHEKY